MQRRESFKNWADSSRMVVDSTPINLTPIKEEDASFAIAASSNGDQSNNIVTVTHSDQNVCRMQIEQAPQSEIVLLAIDQND